MLLYNTREGRIATYRRMFESNRWPEQLANFEALIKYYEDGGRVPQGKEEVWAFDGQASFGIRFYTHLDQMPEGWLYKRRFCDVRSDGTFDTCQQWICSVHNHCHQTRLLTLSLQTVKYHQLHYVPGPDEFLLADREGKVIL